MKWPLDGNPYKSMGLIAHPGRISNVAVTHDGRYLITAGALSDKIVNLWAIDTTALDVSEVHGGSGIDPYVSLLEGGKDGAFFHEIVDYFYLSQLRTQGESSTAAREITHHIPLSEIPHVMRALGYYPTELEIQNICSEVKYSRFTELAQTVDTINLADFIKLYVNHRPVFGIGKHHIDEAFETLSGGGRQTKDLDVSLKWSDIKTKLLTMVHQIFCI
jgi:hypothetical protein